MLTMNESKMQAEFEEWISAPPYERRIDRFGLDEAIDGYLEYGVQLAWEAWQAAHACKQNGEGQEPTMFSVMCQGEIIEVQPTETEARYLAEQEGGSVIPLYTQPSAGVPEDVRAKLFSRWRGCTDHNCIVTGPKAGAGTNGGCQCIERASRSELRLLHSRLSVLLNAAPNPSGAKRRDIGEPSS